MQVFGRRGTGWFWSAHRILLRARRWLHVSYKKLSDNLSNTLAFFLFLYQDFESCVKYHDPECRYIPGLKHDGFGDHRRQTMFFCGHRDDCTWVYSLFGNLQYFMHLIEFSSTKACYNNTFKFHAQTNVEITNFENQIL